MLMSNRRLVILLGLCHALLAQSHGYHITFSNHFEYNPPITAFWLHNDGIKPMDAFDYSFQCADHSGSHHSFDRLSDENGLSLGYAGDEKNWAPRPVSANSTYYINACKIAHEETVSEGSPNSVKNPEVAVEAILFSDGSYDGPFETIRAIQAKRDGLEAALSYWAERLNSENPDGSGLSAIRSEMTRLERLDDMMSARYHPRLGEPEPALRLYWAGRYLVDMEVLQYLNRPKGSFPLQRVNDDHDLLQLIRVGVDRWRQTIDSDEAMKRIRKVLPPVSDPTVDVRRVIEQR